MKNLKSSLQNDLQNTLDLLGEHSSALKDVNIGLERETLRVNKETGRISQNDHPQSIGSPLTHSNITTDFAESLLEFVTNPSDTPEKTLADLSDIQKFTLSKLNNEVIWPNSMPPYIESEDEIQIAKYGTSNDAKMKSLYRKGLSLRYGKMMQVISGIHYNFSLKDHFFETFQKVLGDNQSLQSFKTARYLHACRNVSRFGYIVPYFLGASPVMDKSFLKGKENNFADLNETDSYLPEGESLRLSDIGYGNNKCHFDVSFNNIDEFVQNIQFAVSTPCNIFSQIPVIENGEYNQINNHILQIENEYYASVRPKQIMRKGENFLTALKKRGIEYIELRSIDINPLIAEGISIEAMRFLQLFLTASILTDAAPLSQKEYEHNQKNLKLIAKTGINLEQSFTVQDVTLSVKDALTAVVDWLQPIADLFGEKYQESLSWMRTCIDDPSKLPSQQILNEMKRSGQPYQSFFFDKAKSLFNAQYQQLDPATTASFEASVTATLAKQEEIEAENQITFEKYLENYFKF